MNYNMNIIIKADVFEKHIFPVLLFLFVFNYKLWDNYYKLYTFSHSR
jgi:hypothetical protein